MRCSSIYSNSGRESQPYARLENAAMLGMGQTLSGTQPLPDLLYIESLRIRRRDRNMEDRVYLLRLTP